MADKIKGDIEKVKADIAPYLHKQFLQKPYDESVDVSPVCRLLRRKHSNVEANPYPGEDGKPYLVIKVHCFLSDGKLTYEIKVKGKSIHTHKPKDSLSWIDRLEEWDALMND